MSAPLLPTTLFHTEMKVYKTITTQQLGPQVTKFDEVKKRMVTIPGEWSDIDKNSRLYNKESVISEVRCLGFNYAMSQVCLGYNLVERKTKTGKTIIEKGDLNEEFDIIEVLSVEGLDHVNTLKFEPSPEGLNLVFGYTYSLTHLKNISKHITSKFLLNILEESDPPRMIKIATINLTKMKQKDEILNKWFVHIIENINRYITCYVKYVLQCPHIISDFIFNSKKNPFYETIAMITGIFVGANYQIPETLLNVVVCGKQASVRLIPGLLNATGLLDEKYQESIEKNQDHIKLQVLPFRNKDSTAKPSLKPLNTNGNVIMLLTTEVGKVEWIYFNFGIFGYVNDPRKKVSMNRSHSKLSLNNFKIN